METIDKINEGVCCQSSHHVLCILTSNQMTQLQENLEHVHESLGSAERRLANLGYRIDEDGNVVETNKDL